MNSLRSFKDKLYFTNKEAQESLKIKPASTNVLCSRYAKNGSLIRLKRNFYTLEQKWDNFERNDFLKVANMLQVPSYISFMTALSFYEVTSQVQRGFFESASLKRSLSFQIRSVEFNFYKLNKKYYFDFTRKGDIFIASAEKAFVDIAYLYSFGKYRADFTSIDTAKLNVKKIKEIMSIYPRKTVNTIKKLCRI